MRSGIVGGTMLACLTLFACEPGPEVREAKLRDDPVSVARGRAIYLEHCVLCHGELADGRGVRRSSLSRPPPNFRSPLFTPDPARVRRSIHDGIAGSDMPGWQRLGEQGVDDLTRYVLAVRRSAD